MKLIIKLRISITYVSVWRVNDYSSQKSFRSIKSIFLTGTKLLNQSLNCV